MPRDQPRYDRAVRWRLPAPVVLVALLAGAALDAQVVKDTRQPLRSGIDMILVTATVLDSDGRLVTGLPKEAFAIYEDGEEQPIKVFTNERVRISSRPSPVAWASSSLIAPQPMPRRK